MPQHRQAATGGLEHAAPLERDRGTVRSAEPALGAAIGRLSLARPRSASGASWDVLDRLIATCAMDCLADTRDLAILLLAFASGGRRRSEVARLRVEQLRDEPPARLDPRDRSRPVTMPRNPARPDQDGQRRRGGQGASGLPSGRGAARMAGAGRHREGPIFRAIDRWEAVEEKALTPQSINLIVKRRCAMVGVGAGGVFRRTDCRAEYLTEAARRGIAPPEAMQQSQHRSVQQTASYYNDARARAGQGGKAGALRKLSADNFVSPYCRRHS